MCLVRGSHQILCLKTYNLIDLGYGSDPVNSLRVYLNTQQSLCVSFSHFWLKKCVSCRNGRKIILSEIKDLSTPVVCPNSANIWGLGKKVKIGKAYSIDFPEYWPCKLTFTDSWPWNVILVFHVNDFFFHYFVQLLLDPCECLISTVLWQRVKPSFFS